MLFMQTVIDVDGITGKEITDFILNCDDNNYQKWWRGIHLELHQVKSYQNHIGDLIYMDEFIGKYRMKAKSVVNNAVPGKLIIWQVKKLIRIPIVLILKLEDNENGVLISHTIKAGYKGIGKIFDSIFRHYLPQGFEDAMDEHVKIEFHKLRDLLRAGAVY